MALWGCLMILLRERLGEHLDAVPEILLPEKLDAEGRVALVALGLLAEQLDVGTLAIGLLSGDSPKGNQMDPQRYLVSADGSRSLNVVRTFDRLWRYLDSTETLRNPLDRHPLSDVRTYVCEKRPYD